MARRNLKVWYGRFGATGQPRAVLIALALVLLAGWLVTCNSASVARFVGCLGREMDPNPAPGQKQPPCGPYASPYGRACYIVAADTFGTPIPPKNGDCGDLHGPWQPPAGNKAFCWARFFPKQTIPATIFPAMAEPNEP